MSDTKTTVSGVIAGVCQVVGMFVPAAHQICDPISALALAALGWFAKDSH